MFLEADTASSRDLIGRAEAKLRHQRRLLAMVSKNGDARQLELGKQLVGLLEDRVLMLRRMETDLSTGRGKECQAAEIPMNRDAELINAARLYRIAAGNARKAAEMRSNHSDELLWLADQGDQIATQIDRVREADAAARVFRPLLASASFR